MIWLYFSRVSSVERTNTDIFLFVVIVLSNRWLFNKFDSRGFFLFSRSRVYRRSSIFSFTNISFLSVSFAFYLHWYRQDVFSEKERRQQRLEQISTNDDEETQRCVSSMRKVENFVRNYSKNTFSTIQQEKKTQKLSLEIIVCVRWELLFFSSHWRNGNVYLQIEKRFGKWRVLLGLSNDQRT